MKKTPSMVPHMTTIPATAPPTMAPIFIGFEFSEVLSEAMVDDVMRGVTVPEEVVLVLGKEVVGVEIAVCEEKLEDVVVVASAVFGTANRLSMVNAWPQAMYSND